MLTDRAPFEYVYLSRRLLTDVVRHDEAARPKSRRLISVSLFGFTFSAQRRLPDYDNMHDMASRSTELVSDHTGDLDCGWCPYIRADLDLHRGVFEPLMGWRGGEVACFHGVASTPDGKSVFLALFGSASNLCGYEAGDMPVRGFHPSDMAGLYALMDAIREPGDPEISLDYRIDDHSLYRATIVEEAVDFAIGGGTQPPQSLSVLARRLLDQESYKGHHGTFDRVVVAAPLWIATPIPRPAPMGIPEVGRKP